MDGGLESVGDGLRPGSDPIATWIAREARYRQASWAGEPAQLVVRRHGSRPLVLTAPHSGHHLRNGWVKPADGGTGGLAEMLAERHGCAVVAAAGVQPDDPNWDVGAGAFKQAALTVAPGARFAIDVHGMSRWRSADICIGTGPGADATTLAFVQFCAAQARAAGFAVNVNSPFAAQPDGTMTAFSQRSGRRAMQLEINARLRDPIGAPDQARRLIAWLDQMIILAPQ